MMSLTIGLFTQVSGSGPLGLLVFFSMFSGHKQVAYGRYEDSHETSSLILFERKSKKKLKCHLLQFLFGTSKVNING